MQYQKGKKVLFIAKKIPWANKDGESIVIHNDMDFFHQKGFEISFFGINTKKHFVKDVSHNIPNFIKSFEFEYINTLSIFRLIYLFFFKNKTWYLQRFYSKKIQKKLNDFILNNHFDIIIFEGLPCTLYHINHPVKLIYRAHNVEHLLWKTKKDFLYNMQNPILKKVIYYFYKNMEQLLRKYENTYLNKFDLIATLSKVDSNYFNSYYQNVKTLPIFIGDSILVKRNVERKLKLVILGSMDWQPNLEGTKWFLTNVWNELNHELFELTIAGKGAIDLFKMYSNIHFNEHWQNFEEIKRQNDIMIVPLFSGGGIRIKILEAIQHQLPIITTKKGMEGIEVNDSILISNSENEFIEILNTLEQNRNQLIEIQEKMLDLHLKFKENSLKLETWI
jgi:glycosyltransferase involved in cell wall biosynthesis